MDSMRPSVFNGLQHYAARFAPDFNVRLGNGRTTRLFCLPGPLLSLLDEGNEVVEGAGRQALHAVDFLSVGHNLVH